MAQVFISYGREDENAARRLHLDLEKSGHTVWFDRISLRAGENWKIAIIKAIRLSDAVIVLLSKRSSGRRGFLNKEIREALDVLAEQPEGQPYLIPARLDDCDTPHIDLSLLHRVDMFPNWGVGVQQIEKSLAFKPAATGSAGDLVRIFLSAKVSDFAQEIYDAVASVAHVTSIDWLLGEYDVMIVIEAATVREAQETVAQIRKIRGVVATMTAMAHRLGGR